MARRKKTSPLEDFLDLIAMLPWWVGVALAPVSFVFLHQVASPTPLQGLQPGQMAPAGGPAGAWDLSLIHI